MVTVDLIGRMGNQLFQAAAAIAHAKRMETEYGIPLNTTNNAIWPNALTLFHHLKFIKHGGHIPQWKEEAHSYCPIPAMKEVRLHGFFQSYKYFEDYEDEIKNAFGFTAASGIDSVSIHIRRGDYVLMHDKHPPVNLDYINQAIAMFPNDQFLVFSDDLGWCHKHLKGDRFTFSDGKSQWVDIKTMALCKHNIISNSTFSFWGAYGNNNPDKIVVSPSAAKNWFGPGNSHLSTKDLLPPSWVQIEF